MPTDILEELGLPYGFLVINHVYQDMGNLRKVRIHASFTLFNRVDRLAMLKFVEGIDSRSPCLQKASSFTVYVDSGGDKIRLDLC